VALEELSVELNLVKFTNAFPINRLNFIFVPLTDSVCPWSASLMSRNCQGGAPRHHCFLSFPFYTILDRLPSDLPQWSGDSGAPNQANIMPKKLIRGCRVISKTQALQLVVPNSEESECPRLYQSTASTVYAHRCHFYSVSPTPSCTI
jgi:hypothetical protein